MWKTLSLTWRLLTGKQRAAYIAIALAQQVTNFLDLLGIGAVSLLVMGVASGSIDLDLAGYYRIQIDQISGPLTVGLVLAAALAFLLKAVGNLLLSLLLVKFLARVEVEASSRLASFIFSRSLSDVRKFSNSELQYAVNASTSAMYTGMLTSVASMVTGIGLMAVILVAFFAVNAVAAVAVAVYLLVVVSLIQWFLSQRLGDVGRDTNKAVISGTRSLWDLINSFREVSVLGRQGFFIERYRNARKLLALTNAQITVLKSVPRLIIEQGLLLGVLGFVSWQVLGSDVAEGLASVGVFVVGSIRIIGAVVPVQNAWGALKTTAAKAESSVQLHQEMLESDSGTLENVEPVSKTVDVRSYPLEDQGLSLEMSEVTFGYPGSTVPDVTDISLRARPGGFIALVGPSGAGKTTIADLILGLNVPDRGEILIGGLNPRKIRHDHPGIVTYVPQKPGMVTGSVLENVTIGVPEEEVDLAWAQECIRLAALDRVVGKLPDGLASSLGGQSDKLSGGQLQRLGLARALYPKPRLIILDEATSALDAGSEATVSKNIRELGDAVTLIVIAHRLSTIQHAECIYFIDEGRVVASGSFAKLRQKVPMFKEYVRLMSLSDEES